MGSGHILVYAFDVLMQIYTSCGYTERDAVQNIVRNNLWGLDLDKRAYQLAYFAVMMKARQYDKRLWNRIKKKEFDAKLPNLSHFQNLPVVDYKLLDDKMTAFIKQFENADTYGSLITVQADDEIDSAIDSFEGIHTLKVFVSIKSITYEDTDAKIIDELLDDKRLIESFNRVTSHGVNNSGRIADNKKAFAREFIVCLLRTRFLFDKYIIKREYANENSDGEWSLKELHVSGQQSKKKPYYRNTWFTRKGEHNQERRSNERNIRNIMLQSALRVSYTSPKVMHWITQLLIWLSEDNYVNSLGDDLSMFDSVIERIAGKAVREQFFDVCKDGVYALGVSTPHIVFNYLDFLLWESEPKKYDDFTFEFRNSVEHWYPQNPSEGTFEQWTDGVDQFGNLCIIQRNVNSKFSNMSPEAKKSTFKEMIAKGSIKLRIMSELTEKGNGKAASLYWKDTIFREHEKVMVEKLYKACYLDDEY